MVDHSHIPKQCQIILVYLGSEIHRDGIGWNQKNQKKAFTASCLAAPKKCLQNSTHVHAGMECRDSKWAQSGAKNPKVGTREEQSGNKRGTKWDQESQSGAKNPKVGTREEQSGTKNPKVGPRILKWEQERNKVGPRIPQWEQEREQERNKVGTRIPKWEQERNKVGTKREQERN